MSLAELAENLHYNGVERMPLWPAKVLKTSELQREKDRESPLQVGRHSSKRLPSASNDTSTAMKRYVDTARAWLAECFEKHDVCSRTPKFSRIFG